MESNVRIVTVPLARTVPLALAGALAAAALLGGCAAVPSSADDAAAAAADASAGPASSMPAGQDASAMVATSFGKGSYSDGDRAMVSFMFDAELTGGGETSGFFRYQGSYADGRLDLSGQVSCASFDHPEGRAWIAGTVSANGSTVDFADRKKLPVGRVVGFVVEDASVALTSHIQFPKPLPGDAATAARRFCDAGKWPTDALFTLASGTLGVFP